MSQLVSPAVHAPQRGLRRWGNAASVLIALCALADIAGVWAAWRAHLDGTEAALNLAGTVNWIFYLLCVPAVGTFLVWFWLARADAERRSAAHRHRRGRGWVLGAWFCPVVNLWYPHTIMADIWLADPARSKRPVDWWWGLFLGSLLVDRYAIRAELGNAAAHGFTAALKKGTLAAVLFTGAAVLIIHIIHRIGESPASRDHEAGPLAEV
ncbi:DUF4328 domain-containing protein [Amycolatopsis nigrescens]|uniref:DUF4328 domain-containing protein n=1 Tax=Amycolatopsis nigrescens TaxID=381445 RepID=UPI00036849FB|nr:DUF4328 domain-containing protein [Amycolatopsis nigrescens]